MKNVEKGKVEKGKKVVKIEKALTKPQLKNALKGSEIIFHLGARGSVPRSIKNPVATHEVNATGTGGIKILKREKI